MKSSLLGVAVEEVPEHVIIINESTSNGMFKSDADHVAFKRMMLCSADKNAKCCVNSSVSCKNEIRLPCSMLDRKSLMIVSLDILVHLIFVRK